MSNITLAESYVGKQAVKTLLESPVWETVIGPENGRGQTESNPHAHVHFALKGNMGSMNSGLDPIFWAHHCEVDRFFESWMVGMRVSGHPIPELDSKWKGELLDGYFDRKGAKVSCNVSDVLDASKWAFKYDTLISLDSSKRRPIVSTYKVPKERKLSSMVTGGRVAFAPNPEAAGALAAFKGSDNGMALTGGIKAPSWALNSLSLVLTGHFKHGQTIIVTNEKTELGAAFIFGGQGESHAGHEGMNNNEIHIDLASSVVYLNPSDIKIEITLDGRPWEGQAQLVFV